MRDLLQFVNEMFDRLDQAAVDYMITGSLASTYYAEPRSTMDIDIIVVAAPANILTFVGDLDRQRFYVPSNELILADTQFNVVDLPSGWKLDVMYRKDRPFSIAEFERRRRVSLFGRETYMASPEDVLLAKLEWAKESGSERQRGDAQSILEVQGGSLDHGYLRKWAAELDIEETLLQLAKDRGPNLIS